MKRSPESWNKKGWARTFSHPWFRPLLKMSIATIGIIVLAIATSTGLIPRKHRPSGGMEPLVIALMGLGFALLVFVVVIKGKPWRDPHGSGKSESDNLTWWQILLAITGICLLIFTFPAFTLYRMIRP